MYVRPNFKSKKELKEALKEGKKIEVFLPGGGFSVPTDGTVYLEGPHAPALHRWYAVGQMSGGSLVSAI